MRVVASGPFPGLATQDHLREAPSGAQAPKNSCRRKAETSSERKTSLKAGPDRSLPSLAPRAKDSRQESGRAGTQLRKPWPHRTGGNNNSPITLPGLFLHCACHTLTHLMGPAAEAQVLLCNPRPLPLDPEDHCLCE